MTDKDRLNIGFIGGGNMAQAMIGGLMADGWPAGQLWISEPDAARREKLATLAEGLQLGASNVEVAMHTEVLVLAVKPQVMPAVLSELADAARPAGQLVLSIAAGIPMARISAALGGHIAVVRVMPNQPALVGAGMSVLVASPSVSSEQRQIALELISSTGHALWAEEETLMDAVTAVSGSGPAYFYRLMEAMEEAAIELGLAPGMARTLVCQTALGAARSALDESRSLAELRRSVTSAGGTTAAALAVLEQAGLRDIVQRALIAARERSIELGRAAG